MPPARNFGDPFRGQLSATVIERATARLRSTWRAKISDRNIWRFFDMLRAAAKGASLILGGRCAAEAHGNHTPIGPTFRLRT